MRAYTTTMLRIVTLNNSIKVFTCIELITQKTPHKLILSLICVRVNVKSGCHLKYSAYRQHWKLDAES